MLHQQEQSGFTNLFKFAGGQYRSSTGLFKFGERYYNPNVGRWTQLDPVDPVGAGYVYAGDNPVNAVDPSGKSESPAAHCILYIAGTALVTLGGLALAIIGVATAPTGWGFAILVAGLIIFVGGVLLLMDAVLSCL